MKKYKCAKRHACIVILSFRRKRKISILNLRYFAALVRNDEGLKTLLSIN